MGQTTHTFHSAYLLSSRHPASSLKLTGEHECLHASSPSWIIDSWCVKGAAYFFSARPVPTAGKTCTESSNRAVLTGKARSSSMVSRARTVTVSSAKPRDPWTVLESGKRALRRGLRWDQTARASFCPSRAPATVSVIIPMSQASLALSGACFSAKFRGEEGLANKLPCVVALLEHWRSVSLWPASPVDRDPEGLSWLRMAEWR